MTRLDVHVGGTFADSKRRILEAVERDRRGEAVGEEHVTFVDWDALVRVMTPRRFELLRHLRRTPEASIAALARSLGRDYKRVHEDVEVLCAAGLVERGTTGLKTEWDEIRTSIAL